MKKVSIAVPCYNEAGNVRPMAETLTAIMKELPYNYEIVFTDNCSTDGTKDILRELAKADKHIKVLINNRNYGPGGRSGRNTLQYLSGDVIIGIPADFQEPPELIPDFIHYWEQGYKVVCGQKTGSKEGRLKYACRSLYYGIIQALSDTPQYEHMSGITLYDREVMLELAKSDYDFYFRFAMADMGYDVKLIQYQQRARRSGKTSYNIWRSLSFAIDSMIATSVAPLRMMTILGLTMSACSFIIGFVYLVLKLINWHSFQAGTAPVLIGLFFLGALQLFFMGILGEYIGVILRKVTRKPDVIVGEMINFDDRSKGPEEKISKTGVLNG